MDFEDYDDYNEEPVQEFRDERNAFERAGFRNDLDINIEDIERKSRTKKTPLERFIESVNAISLNLISTENIIDQNDRKILLESIKNLEKPDYKNATGYIFGYIVTKGGNEINKLKLSKLVSLLRKNLIEDKSIQPPDIIRYGRLWQNIVKM